MKKDANHIIVWVVAACLVLGILWLGRLAAMGLLFFLAYWILMIRVPGLKAMARRFPLLADILGTVSVAWLCPGDGFQKMVSVSIAALCITLWCSYQRASYLRAKRVPATP